jgi:uncharacterized protein YcbK (DUF882 family)
VPSCFAPKVTLSLPSSRAGLCLGLAILLVTFGSESLQNAVAEGDTRTISLHHMHTGEDLTVTYKRNGRYDDAALEKLNWELRDWRRGEAIKMDPRLIDLVWEVHRDLGATKPIEIVCGYRSPQTNSMLRSRSSGVAQFSQHTLGKAMDFYIPGVPLADLRAAGLRLARGGVGFYPTSGSPFVHLDVGGIRYWPRMSRDELARIFPDGKTVYIPSDGRPLRNYELALAEIHRRGTEKSGGTVLAKLFGLNQNSDDDGEETSTPPAPSRSTVFKPAATSAATERGKTETPAALLARTKPSSQKLASADTPAAAPPPASVPASTSAPASASATPAPRHHTQQSETAAAPSPSAVSAVVSAALTPNQIIEQRGYWQGLPDEADALAPQLTTAKQRLTKRIVNAASAAAAAVQRAISVRRAYADGAPEEPDTTASIAMLRADRLSPELALAYAALPEAGSGKPLAATTIAAKKAPRTSGGVTKTATVARDAADDNGQPAEPWLHSMMVAPDAQTFLTMTRLGPPNFSNLTPLMQKPKTVVVTTFGADPRQGVSADGFSGSAIVFAATMSFGQRTASLQ